MSTASCHWLPEAVFAECDAVHGPRAPMTAMQTQSGDPISLRDWIAKHTPSRHRVREELPAAPHVIHIWSVETSAAQGLRTCFASEEYFSSSHAGSLMMKKSRSLFCTGIAARTASFLPSHECW